MRDLGFLIQAEKESLVQLLSSLVAISKDMLEFVASMASGDYNKRVVPKLPWLSCMEDLAKVKCREQLVECKEWCATHMKEYATQQHDTLSFVDSVTIKYAYRHPAADILGSITDACYQEPRAFLCIALFCHKCRAKKKISTPFLTDDEAKKVTQEIMHTFLDPFQLWKPYILEHGTTTGFPPYFVWFAPDFLDYVCSIHECKYMELSIPLEIILLIYNHTCYQNIRRRMEYLGKTEKPYSTPDLTVCHTENVNMTHDLVQSQSTIED
jgi:hypothetical protein